MLEKELIYYCAPTLAGMKTANLFSFKFQEKDKFLKDIFALNNAANEKGVKIDILSIRENRALIYVYRIKALVKDLSKPGVFDILTKYGYDAKALCKKYEHCQAVYRRVFNNDRNIAQMIVSA